MLHFFGEVEVVFGLWAVVAARRDRALPRMGRRRRTTSTTRVNYTEPLFVVVIMALASTRPILGLAEAALRRVARARRRHAGGVVGRDPHDRAAARVAHHRAGGDDHLRAAARRASSSTSSRRTRLKYATLGLLFVNVSIGGTLTHFAAPPVLMVARPWNWDTPFMLRRTSAGARSLAIVRVDRRCTTWSSAASCARSPRARAVHDVEQPDEDARAAAALLPVPAWVTLAHVGFIAWTVVNAHYPALFVGGFLFFLGFVARDGAPTRARSTLRAPLLVGFFLAGARHSRRAAGLVDRADAREPVRDAAVLRRHHADRVQRQRADHLPGDAGARPQRAAEVRRRRREP